MNITVTAEKPENGKVIAKVTVAAADVDKAVKGAYKDIANKYAFQGFRKGKAPRAVINGMIGREAVLAQATDDLVNDALPLILEELDVVALANPSFGEDMSMVVEGEDYGCEATIEVAPEFELDSYDAPAINMPPEEATEAEVDQQVEQLMSYHATYEDDDADRECVAGDVVVVDVVNNEGLESLAGEDRQISLTGSYLPEEFVSGVEGMKKGEQKDIEWTEAHGEHEHARRCSVTLKSIKKSVTPELTDEFAKSSFGYETVAELRDAVKEEIAEDKKQSLPALKQDRVVEAIGEQLTVEELPKNYTELVYQETAQSFLQTLQQQGMSLDMYLAMRGAKVDDFIADLRSQSEERARQSLALDSLAMHLSVEVTEDDIKAEFERSGVKDVDASYKEWIEGGQMPRLRESIRRTKALEWLTDNATVTVVDEVAEARAKDAE